MTYSVFIYNRSTKDKRLAINGLDEQQAEEFAAKMREIYPQCPGQDWQGFDVTIEEEPEEEPAPADPTFDEMQAGLQKALAKLLQAEEIVDKVDLVYTRDRIRTLRHTLETQLTPERRVIYKVLR